MFDALAPFFQHPWLLLAVAAALVPPVIEWLFRRRRRRVELPTLRFLLDEETRQQVRRQDRWLLLIRMAILAALGLAVSRPLWREDTLGGSGPREVFVVLDGTASMQQQTDVSTAFARGRKQAAELVRGLPEGTRVSFLTFGDRLAPPVFAQTDRSTVAATIEQTQPGSGSAPVATALEAIAERIASEKIPWSEVYVVSDLQRATWAGSGANAAAGSKRSDARGALASLSKSAETYVIDVGGRPAFNLLVTGFEPEEPVLTAGLPARFRATIETRGEVPADLRVAVSLLVDHAKKSVQQVAVGSEPVAVSFDVRLADPGEHLVEVVVEGDDHRIDNRRFWLCQVPPFRSVLVVDETAETPRPESLFLAHAIGPPTGPGLDPLSHFRPKSIVPTKLSFENLAEHAAVVWTGGRLLTTEMVAQLEPYVADGGAAWFFVGPHVSAYDWDRLLHKGGKGLLPCRLGPVETLAADRNVTAEFRDSADPRLARHFARSPSNPDASVVKRLRLEFASPEEQAAAKVLARFSDGAPALVEKSFGRGRVLLADFTVGPDWSYLPACPEFPAFVQEVLHSLVGQPDASVNLEIGQRFEQPVFVSAQHLLLRRPDGAKERLAPRQKAGTEDRWAVSFDGTSDPGAYRLETIPEVVPRRRFVVNPDAQEGDLARFEADEFRDVFGPAGGVRLGPEQDAVQFAAQRHTVTELAPYVLWTVFAALAVETAMAWRFGRRREEVPA